jgi:hypothetical protein
MSLLALVTTVQDFVLSIFMPATASLPLRTVPDLAGHLVMFAKVVIAMILLGIYISFVYTIIVRRSTRPLPPLASDDRIAFASALEPLIRVSRFSTGDRVVKIVIHLEPPSTEHASEAQTAGGSLHTHPGVVPQASAGTASPTGGGINTTAQAPTEAAPSHLPSTPQSKLKRGFPRRYAQSQVRCLTTCLFWRC